MLLAGEPVWPRGPRPSSRSKRPTREMAPRRQLNFQQRTALTAGSVTGQERVSWGFVGPKSFMAVLLLGSYEHRVPAVPGRSLRGHFNAVCDGVENHVRMYRGDYGTSTARSRGPPSGRWNELIEHITPSYTRLEKSTFPTKRTRSPDISPVRQENFRFGGASERTLRLLEQSPTTCAGARKSAFLGHGCRYRRLRRSPHFWSFRFWNLHNSQLWRAERSRKCRFGRRARNSRVGRSRISPATIETLVGASRAQGTGALTSVFALRPRC